MDIESGTATPRSAVSCTVRVRDHEIVQDKPPASGGRDEGPMASELLLASLLSCQLSTFAKVAAKRRSAATARGVTGHLHFDDKQDIARIVVEWDIEDAQGKERDTLIRLTDRTCTISRALKAPVEAT